MSDEPMQTLLEDWFRAREASPYDARHSTSRVVARLPQVHQRGRWWPLPPLDRPVSAFPSRELALAHMPATNGRTRPRGFTMFSAAKLMVAAVIVALSGGFLLSGALTTPQDSDVPGSASESPGAEASSEILFELSVPRWALPDDPTALEAGGWVLQAGTDVTGKPQASQGNESMRNRAIIVTSGTMLIEPASESLVWRASGATPETAPAGEALTLRPGEAIYLPAVPADEVDPERYLRLANPGPDDATGATFHVHEGSTASPFGGFPPGLRWGTWRGELFALVNAADWTAADEILFQLKRHQAEPGATIESAVVPATALYMVESGVVEWIISGPGGEFSNSWRPGFSYAFLPTGDIVQTLTVEGDKAASLLELVALPRSPATD